jgi:hypothetical protein
LSGTADGKGGQVLADLPAQSPECWCDLGNDHLSRLDISRMACRFDLGVFIV